MRRAIDPSAFTLEPGELAGLACEADIESRLIIECGPRDWRVRHGPFDGGDFADLPQTHWTLLVQDVDKYLPQVSALIDRFDFIPTWRIDDIMVSYATDRGGVGPHTDAYDVFLMQGLGRRRWRLSYRDCTDRDLVPDIEQRILAHFTTDEDWLLEPGDVLYLPPGVAHWGNADGECMTYSLGFRAPSRQELAADWYQHLVALADQERLRDPPRGSSGATFGDDVVRTAARLIDALPSTATSEFRRWLGGYFTEPKPQFHVEAARQTLDQSGFERLLAELIAHGAAIQRHPFARFAWSKGPEDELWLFCHGECLELATDHLATVQTICQQRRLDASRLAALIDKDAQAPALLLQLFNRGLLEADWDAA